MPLLARWPHNRGGRAQARFRQPSAGGQRAKNSGAQPGFGDHYGQATLFWNSQTPVEKQHIVKALQFELSKVETRKVRQRILC